MGDTTDIVLSTVATLNATILADEGIDPRVKAIIMTKLEECALWAPKLRPPVEEAVQSQPEEPSEESEA